MSTLGFMDAIIILCGLYMVYQAWDMKKTGIIPNSMVGKGYDPNKACDKQGFIDEMYGKTIAFGSLIAVGGVIDYLNDLYFNIPNFVIFYTIIFLAIVVIYCRIAMVAQKKYLAPRK